MRVPSGVGTIKKKQTILLCCRNEGQWETSEQTAKAKSAGCTCISRNRLMERGPNHPERERAEDKASRL